MKITKKELQGIIKEEAMKFKRALELKKELNEVEKQLAEVYAGDVFSPEKQGGVHTGQRKPVFKKKGDALVEDQPIAEEKPAFEGECEKLAEEKVEECVATEETNVAEEEAVCENLDEPIEGESVAQKVDHQKNVDDGMLKSTHVKENEEKKEPVLTEEVKRMKKLAGIL